MKNKNSNIIKIFDVEILFKKIFFRNFIKQSFFFVILLNFFIYL